MNLGSPDDCAEYVQRFVSSHKRSNLDDDRVRIFREIWEVIHTGHYKDVFVQSRRDLYLIAQDLKKGHDIYSQLYIDSLVGSICGIRDISIIVKGVALNSVIKRPFNEDAIPTKFHGIAEAVPKVASMNDFIVKFMGKQPCVIPGGCSIWNACQKWRCTEWWKSFMGERFVPVEIGVYTDESFQVRFVQLSEFITIMDEDRETDPRSKPYLAQQDITTLFPELEEDVLPLPDLISCIGIVDARPLFMGPAGTFTPFHRDPYDNFLCQIVGKKRARISSDPSGNKTIQEALIIPGDCLYIPRGWYHAVDSITPSISLAHFIDN
jgi:hypothetical protein